MRAGMPENDGEPGRVALARRSGGVSKLDEQRFLCRRRFQCLSQTPISRSTRAHVVSVADAACLPTASSCLQHAPVGGELAAALLAAVCWRVLSVRETSCGDRLVRAAWQLRLRGRYARQLDLHGNGDSAARMYRLVLRLQVNDAPRMRRAANIFATVIGAPGGPHAKQLCAHLQGNVPPPASTARLSTRAPSSTEIIPLARRVTLASV